MLDCSLGLMAVYTCIHTGSEALYWRSALYDLNSCTVLYSIVRRLAEKQDPQLCVLDFLTLPVYPSPPTPLHLFLSLEFSEPAVY